MGHLHPAIVSLKLLLDPDSEARIRAEWQALADAGLSRRAAHTAPSNRPQITILVRPSLPTLTRDQLSELVALPLATTMGEPILFGAGDRRVLVRSVVPTEELLRLHATIQAIAEVGEDVAHTRPGEWTPHLARPPHQSGYDSAGAQDCRRRQGGVHDPGGATSLPRWDAESARVTYLL